ncbi:hypothetical protein ACFL53_00760 [Pseudomonadota bacterium]
MAQIVIHILFRMAAVILVFIVPAIVGFWLVELLEPQILNGLFQRPTLLPPSLKEVPLGGSI